MSFESIVRDIKNMRIQGAQNVAKESINAISEKYRILQQRNETASLKKYMSILEKTRSTEPCMRNALHCFYDNIKNKDPAKVVRDIHQHFIISEVCIAEFASKKIKNNSIIFTHCHSGTVIKALLKAKKERKRFVVHNTETRPHLQGRITAKELSKAKIPVVHFVDSAMRVAIKDADIVFLGADAVSSEGFVYNKIGSELVCEVAKDYDIPVYICSDSWKFDAQTIFGFEEIIEQRHAKEVWLNPPSRVKISNYAFEKIAPSLITGIITELGIIRPELLTEEVKKAYPWMFSKQI
jgi:ribose 1,5-bisphosphate isomerase